MSLHSLGQTDLNIQVEPYISAEEILQGLKEFIKLNNKYKPNKKQINFKNSLPDYIEFKHYDSNISNFFIKKNKTLFKELI